MCLQRLVNFSLIQSYGLNSAVHHGSVADSLPAVTSAVLHRQRNFSEKGMSMSDTCWAGAQVQNKSIYERALPGAGEVLQMRATGRINILSARQVDAGI